MFVTLFKIASSLFFVIVFLMVIHGIWYNSNNKILKQFIKYLAALDVSLVCLMFILSIWSQ